MKASGQCRISSTQNRLRSLPGTRVFDGASESPSAGYASVRWSAGHRYCQNHLREQVARRPRVFTPEAFQIVAGGPQRCADHRSIVHMIPHAEGVQEFPHRSGVRGLSTQVGKVTNERTIAVICRVKDNGKLLFVTTYALE